MATWRQMEEQAPDLAGPGRKLWQQHGLMYLATVRADGSPRLHPVAPVLAVGEIFIAMPQESPKWHDLSRDPRCVLHALPGPRDDEFALRCLAREKPEALSAVRSAGGHVIHDDDHIIGFDIEAADFGWWEQVGQPGAFSVRTRWTPRGGLRQLPGLRARQQVAAGSAVPDCVESALNQDGAGTGTAAPSHEGLTAPDGRKPRGRRCRRLAAPCQRQPRAPAGDQPQRDLAAGVGQQPRTDR